MRPRAERHVRRGTGALTDLRRTDTPFHTARLLGPKKFAGNFGEYFPTAESTPNAALTGLGGADEPKRAVFELEGAEFQRNGKSKNLSFSTRQTRSQARLNRLGSSSSPVALRSCSLFVDDAALGTAGSSDRCSYNVATCAVGSICPAGTAVSADCADRSAFNESPCACTALQELAATGGSYMQNQAPWNDLANKAYCQDGSLGVDCAPVDGVQLPTVVFGPSTGLAGALPPSLGELGSSLTELGLGGNAITSLPTEIGALTYLVELEMFDNALTLLPTEIGALAGLTYLELFLNAITSVPTEMAALAGLTYLDLDNNQLTGVPAEFRTWGPSNACILFNNPGFSCANVGAGTSCCTGATNPFGGQGNNCGEGLSGGPCYAG